MAHVRCSRVPAPALWFAALLASVAMLAFPAVGAAKHKPPRPDLAVKPFRFVPAGGASGQFPLVLLERDGTGRYGLAFTVKNLGGNRSAPSNLRVIVKGSSHDTVHVRRLPPGGHGTFSVSYDQDFDAPGIYKTFACADFGDGVNESREHNNCSNIIRIRVEPRFWDVHTFAVHDPLSTGGIFDTTAVDMDFHYRGLADTGTTGGLAFTWSAEGTVDEVLSGGIPGCTWSGHGDVFHARWGIAQPTGFLEISTGLTAYGAQVRDDNATYIGNFTCPPDPPDPNPYTIEKLQTFSSAGSSSRGMSPSAESLSGSYVSPSQFAPAEYTWLFKADIP
jgi:CARDB